MEPQRPDLQATVERLANLPRPAELPAPEPWEVPELRTESDARLSGRWLTNMPSRFVDAELGQLGGAPPQPGPPQRLVEWAANPAGRNLVLWGPVGCGKTHAGVAACRPAHFDRCQQVVFAPVVELLDALRPDGRPDAMAEAMEADVLLLDDLGAERPTEWTAERLYAVINRRWLEQRPVVATTNLPLTNKVAPEGYTGKTLEEALGGRMFSRLVGSGAVVLRLGGPDRRR